MSDSGPDLEVKAEIPVNRWPLVFAVFAAMAVLFYILEPILLPFVLGALTGYLGDPLVDRVEERGGSRTFGVILVFLFFTTLSLVALFFAVPVLLQQLDGLIGRIPVLYAWLRDVAVPWLQSRTLVTGANLPQIDWSAQLLENWQSLGKVTATTISRITGSGLGLLLGMANIALVPVVAFYLMRDWDDIAERILHLMPKAWQAGTQQMVREADEVVGAFLRGQFIVMCALGALYAAGLYLAGIELALLLGLIAGLASIVPYLGFIVGITASLIAAWLQFHEPLPLLYVAAVFGVGQLIESMVLTPVLVGDRIGLHPVMVIFALMAGGQLAGFVGVVVALPVAAVIKVFASHALVHYRNSSLYTDPDEDSGQDSNHGDREFDGDA
ncbi:AI-2E family transporter [Congregibacter litoralis]|uniref:Putative permease n=1 Tax=Congregibacter litoralis KT71 TaxID=314285 RepID=A4ACL4_9GAMM|nr:AI-2E family transporter [Congregibacter litoralis]EAQ96228.1 putative permease [Congregibacter litoralis KT71]